MFVQPVLVYEADAAALRRAYERAMSRGVRPAVYTHELFETNHDEANRAAVAAVPAGRARSRRHCLPGRAQGRGQGRRPAALPPVSRDPTVGVVSPGAMGSAVGAALARGGARVVATLVGRSERTAGSPRTGRARARARPRIGGTRCGRRAVDRPARGGRVGRPRRRDAARDSGVRSPLVADLNAIAPATARAIEDELAQRGARARRRLDLRPAAVEAWDDARLPLGRARRRGRRRFRSTGVERIVVGDEVGAASAVKMSTASVYKGTSALLAQALLAADANGVLEHVLDDLRAGSPELVANVERRLASAASKSARYVGEMREIAATQAAAASRRRSSRRWRRCSRRCPTSELARSAPEDLPRDMTLDDVLARLRDERRTNVGA